VGTKGSLPLDGEVSTTCPVRSDILGITRMEKSGRAAV
jgi:hypothetical protein